MGNAGERNTLRLLFPLSRCPSAVKKHAASRINVRRISPSPASFAEVIGDTFPMPATRRGGFHQWGGGAIRSHFAKRAADFWAKKLARILTDTPIRRLPDCATIGRNSMVWSWRSSLLSNYPMKKNWRSCNDSINSGCGTPWMRNVIASFAAKSLPGGKSR